MNLPIQSIPVNRILSRFPQKQSFFYEGSEKGIKANSFLCSPCKTVVGGLGGAIVGMGCTEAAAAFEVACNAAFDVESLGLAAIPCTAAAAALGIACKAGAGSVTQGMIDSVAVEACGWAC
jgi:hypothetical protein